MLFFNLDIFINILMVLFNECGQDVDGYVQGVDVDGIRTS